ncbi:MAG: hypothetical protein ACYSU0_13715 [Planctomycetota bacterium]|jgi:hypothetical protein
MFGGKGLYQKTINVLGRVVVGLFAATVAAFLFYAFACSLNRPGPKTLTERILLFLLSDAFLVMAVFCSLVAVCLLIGPREWLAKRVAHHGRRALVFGVGVALLVSVCTLVIWHLEGW